MSWPWSRKPERPQPEPWVPDAWPCDSRTLERWLREMLLESARNDEMKIDGIDGIRISADVTGPEISTLLIDATGIEITLDAAETQPQPETPDAADAPPVAVRTAGALRSARLVADPVVIQGFDVHLDGTVHDVAFDWLRYETAQMATTPVGAFSFAEPEGQPAQHPSGTFSARMRASDIAPMISAIMKPLLATAGVRLRRLEATVTTSSRRKVTANALASVRWKIFSATVRATAVARVDPDGIITLKRLRLHSWNPFIAIALAMMRNDLREAEGQRLDLNEGRSDGSMTARIHDLRVAADEDVAVSARFS